jgi:hypothetical protein
MVKLRLLPPVITQVILCENNMKLYELKDLMFKGELSNLAVSTDSSQCMLSTDDWLSYFNRGAKTVCEGFPFIKGYKEFTTSTHTTTKDTIGDVNFIQSYYATDVVNNCTVPINDVFHSMGIMCNSLGEVTLPKTVIPITVKVEYSKYPDELTESDYNIDIPLPSKVIELVRLYIAHHYYSKMNSADNLLVAKGYYDRYNSMVQDVRYKDTLNTSEAGHNRFSSSGFV